MPQVVNFSGGKDSTAMLHLMLEKGETIDEVIFFDSGWDWPQMLDHIDLVERKTGIKITRLKPEKSFDYWFFEHPFTSKKHEQLIGYGWPGATYRWCTREKVQTINNHLKAKYLFQDVTRCIGYAVGEEKRAKGEGVKKHCRFPLLEWNMDEWDCKRLCYDLGYTFGGLYDYFNRVSCWCCPLQNQKELFLKKRHFPEIYQKMMEMELKINQIRKDLGLQPPPSFKSDRTLLQLDTQIRGMDQ